MTGGRGGWSSYSGFLCGVKINNIVNCANMTNSGGSRGGGGPGGLKVWIRHGLIRQWIKSGL